MRRADIVLATMTVFFIAKMGVAHTIDPNAYIHPSVILIGNVTVGPYTYIDAGTVLTGKVRIGHHTVVRCNVTMRGDVTVGNYTHVYDNVCIEGGRPSKANVPRGSQTNTEAERAIIGNHCWVNHGATMHGTIMEDESAVNLNGCCDYGTILRKGAALANGSATHTGQAIPANCFAEGVPAVIKKRNITDEDRQQYFGLIPKQWTIMDGEWIEGVIRKIKAKEARKKETGKK